LRSWGAKFGLSVKIVRTRERVALGFCLCTEEGRVVARGERGMTLDEIANELLKREKKRVRRV
jgi:hypothetical protein